jgi:hypothetical protein
MLSILDSQLFPDECIVLDTGKELIYPIFKNGSTSLVKNFKEASLADIKSADSITVFVREPLDRFYSGVNTFIQHNLQLDTSTVIELVTRHLFLNRHFSPQFFWIVNLQRFTNAKLKLKNISSLNSVTKFHENKSLSNSISKHFEDNNKLHFYMALDKVLYWDLIDKIVTFKQILDELKQQYPDVYNEVIERSKTLCNVLG